MQYNMVVGGGEKPLEKKMKVQGGWGDDRNAQYIHLNHFVRVISATTSGSSSSF